MGMCLAVVVVALVVGWYGYWAWRENVRTGTTVRERLADGQIRCRGCGVVVAATKARDGTCGAEHCLTSDARGRARMDEARAATGDLTCDLTVVRTEVRGTWEAPVEWTAVWRAR